MLLVGVITTNVFSRSFNFPFEKKMPSIVLQYRHKKTIGRLDVKYFNCIFITMLENRVNRTDVLTDRQTERKSRSFATKKLKKSIERKQMYYIYKDTL